MANTLHPGLYVLDAPRVQRPSSPVGTSVGAFVGIASKGQPNKATFISNWGDFVREFGGYINDSYLAYAVRSFFTAGGSSCWVTRVESSVTSADTASATLQASSSPSVTLEATSPGTWANDIVVEAIKETAEFSLVVSRDGLILERYTNLTIANVEEKINGNSEYIVVTEVGSNIPDSSTVTLLGGTNGSSGISDSDYIGDPANRSGIYSFDTVEINLISIPGVTTKAVHNALTQYSSDRGTVYAVLDAPIGSSPTDIKTYKDELNASEYGAIYYPWFSVPDPLGTVKFIPPSGEQMGIMARTDSIVGVWKAPAGIDTALVNSIDVEYTVSDSEHDLLNPANINVIRTFPGVGTVVWGSRGLDGTMVNHTRLRLFIKSWFKRNFLWTVFQPIDDTLLGPAGTVAVNGNSFLRDLYQQGAFDGSGGEDSFFVQCDRENNTPESIAQNKLYIRVGYRNKGVAEFVIVDIGIVADEAN